MMRWLARLLRRADTTLPVIAPPRVVYRGYDWTQTSKLVPTGAAAQAKLVATRLESSRPSTHPQEAER